MGRSYNVRPSSIHLALLVTAHLGAALTVLIDRLFHPEIASMMFVLIVLSLNCDLRKRGWRRLRVFEDDWFVDGQGPQKISGSVFTGHWFVVLRFSSAGWVVIGRDSLPENEFKRFAVLLRARANRMMVE